MPTTQFRGLSVRYEKCQQAVVCFCFAVLLKTTSLKTARATSDLSSDVVLKILSESPDTHMEEIYFGEKRKKIRGLRDTRPF